MNHFASPQFWDAFEELPLTIKTSAKKNFELLKSDSRHPSLQFKKTGRYWSARASSGYRALALEVSGEFIWFWIGTHDRYLQIIKG